MTRLPYPLRIVHARPRLFVAVLVGVVSFFVFPAQWSPLTRGLAAWDVGIGLDLMLSYWLIAHEAGARIRSRAAREDDGKVTILLLTVGAAVASLFAITAQLSVSNAPGGHSYTLIFATATIILTWFFLHTIFALHYAHEFYGSNARRGSGLKFPGDAEPGYWDFVYFSFVIGMTSQVSDVAVSDKAIRRVVFLHGVVSFFFNIGLLALTFNIAANAIQKT